MQTQMELNQHGNGLGEVLCELLNPCFELPAFVSKGIKCGAPQDEPYLLNTSRAILPIRSKDLELQLVVRADALKLGVKHCEFVWGENIPIVDWLRKRLLLEILFSFAALGYSKLGSVSAPDFYILVQPTLRALSDLPVVGIIGAHDNAYFLVDIHDGELRSYCYFDSDGVGARLIGSFAQHLQSPTLIDEFAEFIERCVLGRAQTDAQPPLYLRAKISEYLNTNVFAPMAQYQLFANTEYDVDVTVMRARVVQPSPTQPLASEFIGGFPLRVTLPERACEFNCTLVSPVAYDLLLVGGRAEIAARNNTLGYIKDGYLPTGALLHFALNKIAEHEIDANGAVGCEITYRWGYNTMTLHTIAAHLQVDYTSAAPRYLTILTNAKSDDALVLVGYLEEDENAEDYEGGRGARFVCTSERAVPLTDIFNALADTDALRAALNW